jgi:hypothetical protein
MRCWEVSVQSYITKVTRNGNSKAQISLMQWPEFNDKGLS